MSHFTILVIGDNIEIQLAPYDENLQAEPHREDEDVDLDHIRTYIEERRQDHADWVAAGRPVVKPDIIKDQTAYYKQRGIEEIDNGTTKLPAPDASDLEVVRWYHDDSYDVDEDGQWYRMSTYNPDSKWDWYTIGGRWAGFFKTKTVTGQMPNIPTNPFSAELTKQDRDYFEKEGKLDGRHVDQARKRDIDFQGMRDDAAFKAGQRWDAYQRLVADTPPSDSWDTVLNRHLSTAGYDRDQFSTLTDEQRTEYHAAVNAARTEYHAQARIVRMRTDDDFSWSNPEDFVDDRDEHMRSAAANATSTYAVVIDGVWHGKGDMGWWGMSNDKIEQAEWDAKITELIDAQDDDTLFTLIDAHI